MQYAPPTRIFGGHPSRVNPANACEILLERYAGTGTFHTPKNTYTRTEGSLRASRLTSEIARDTAPWSSAGVGLWDGGGADPLAVVIALALGGAMDGPNERRAFGGV